MSQPPPYTRTTDFSQDEVNNRGGRSTVATADLDAELDAVATSVNAIVGNLALNQRDDGEIRDQRVKLHTLAPEVLKLVAAFGGLIRGTWVTATAYALKDVVTQGGNTYVCAVAHTSGVFATDLAAVKWVLVQLGVATAASGVPFSPTATLAATNVQSAIDEADTENRALTAAVSAALAAYIASLSASSGSTLVGTIAAGTGAVSRTEQDKLRDTVSAFDFMSTAQIADVQAGTLTLDVTAAIQAAEDAAATANKSVFFPGGSYRCNSGLTKKSVDWFGEGLYKSQLFYYGNSVLLNGVGTSGARKQFTCSHIGFDGTNAGTSAECITLGWNQRSTPLDNARIYNFGKYGIHFTDQNWIVYFRSVIVDQCGRTNIDGAGIYKDPGIATGSWNDINWFGLNVESSGSVTSTAGGINIQSTVANRGLRFFGLDVEGCFGTHEMFITNMGDFEIHGHYTETTASTIAMHLQGCQGGIHGSFARGVAATNYLKLSAGSGAYSGAVSIFGLTHSGYTTTFAGDDNLLGLFGVTPTPTVSTPSKTLQVYGDVAPRWSVNRNAVAQTVATGAFTLVAFTTKRFDLLSSFNTGTSTGLPINIGLYQVDVQVTWTAAVDLDTLLMDILLGGAVYKSIKQPACGTGPQTVRFSGQIDTTGTSQTLSVQVRQSSGSNKDIDGAIELTWMNVSFIGRTS